MSSDGQPVPPASRSEPLSDIERSAARYLFAISVLSGTGSERIRTGELEEFLNVTPASVTEMVSKLDDQGLVEYEKYRGVTLTESGRTLAARVGWRFCTVATFFDSELETTLDGRTAFDIGFELPKDGVVRLRDLVNSSCLGLCPESNGDTERCMA